MKRARDQFHVLCSSQSLSSATLTSGQAFRWKFSEEDNVWRSPLGRSVYALRWTDDCVEYCVDVCSDGDGDDVTHEAFLKDYFRLDKDLDVLMKEWAKRDSFFTSSSVKQGLRQIRQDPLECLISFICSQNNNIKRITSMIDTLCQEYGTLLDDKKHFSFPTLLQLQGATEERLRELGFGYRAPYVCHAVKWLQQKEDPNAFLKSLRAASIEECRTHLTQINGVGLKVADCVALFSLDQLNVVPVDTHVWQVAQERYMRNTDIQNVKTLTPKVYRQVSDHLTKMWGPDAGWAHTFVFFNRIETKQNKK